MPRSSSCGRLGCRAGHDSLPPGVLLPLAICVRKEITAGGHPGEMVQQFPSVLTGRDRGLRLTRVVELPAPRQHVPRV